ncbi:hypothetical protein [Catellatospora tritici]|uniref:hypothetical protein n=1 Tax=Catellatospora tritici TaxID=2851566 RepID=UPI001C2DB537|nr:hypothetical protein [Catellatospora tritici]MBV1855816.1 hypothetical protein [Catellatospora tritici]
MDVVRATVAGQAPDELPFVDQVTRLCTADPRIMYHPGDRRPGVLADGLSLFLVVATPILFGVLNDLATQAATSGLRAVWERLRRRGRRVLRLDPAAALQPYTPEQILYATTEVTSRLLRLGMPAAQVKAIADEFAHQLGGVR